MQNAEVSVFVGRVECALLARGDRTKRVAAWPIGGRSTLNSVWSARRRGTHGKVIVGFEGNNAILDTR